MSPNMKRRLITGALMGVSGGLLMIGLIVLSCRRSMTSCMSSGDEALFPAFIGAMLGGMAVYQLFGQQGRRGWLLATGGAVLATTIGASVGLIVLGALVEGVPVLGKVEALFSGPLVLLLAFQRVPGAILLWGGCMISSHLVLRRFFQ